MACCCSCKNLDTKKKASGAQCGAKYYCKKMKTYVTGDTNECKKYEVSGRNNNDIEKIYKEGKTYSNDTISIGTYVIFLIILVILLIILRIACPSMF